MDQLIPSLAALVEPFRDCFRIEVFYTFQILIAGWIICLGPHTISEVWQATGLEFPGTPYLTGLSGTGKSPNVGVLSQLFVENIFSGECFSGPGRVVPKGLRRVKVADKRRKSWRRPSLRLQKLNTNSRK